MVSTAESGSEWPFIILADLAYRVDYEQCDEATCQCPLKGRANRKRRRVLDEYAFAVHHVQNCGCDLQEVQSCENASDEYNATCEAVDVAERVAEVVCR